ncbi:hypothetical protein BDV19DRAFT_368526 [Aspergillus venezuelensis]
MNILQDPAHKFKGSCIACSICVLTSFVTPLALGARLNKAPIIRPGCFVWLKRWIKRRENLPSSRSSQKPFLVVYWERRELLASVCVVYSETGSVRKVSRRCE